MNNDKCNCNHQPSHCDGDANIDMGVCEKNINILPMLQTYTTKLLKPNMQCCKNILTQQMIACENYKYVICWDFDLKGKTITVPENCILEFDGGSLKNGTIIGQDTVFINVGDVDIWGEYLTREGTWREHSGGGGDIQDAFGKVKVGEDTIEAEGNDTLKIEAGENVTIEADTESKKITISTEGEKQVQSNWNESNPQSKAYIKNKPNLAKVATTGDYNDLANKPDIPEGVIVDNALDSNSTNPVQNKVITNKFLDYYTKNEVYNTRQTYNKNEVYNKEETANILSNTEKTDTVIVDIGEADMIELSPFDTEAGMAFKKTGEIVARNDATIKKYEIIPGWTYYFDGKFNTTFNYYFVAWYGEDGDYISTEPYAGSSSVVREYEKQPVTAPANAKYLYLNTQDSMQSEVESSIFTANEGSIEDIPAALEGLIPNVIDPETGKSSRANKLYRVRRPSNTGSSDWAWNGYKWVWLGNNDYGIDDEPTPNSDNVPKSGGVSAYTGRYMNNNTGLIEAFTDSKGRIYIGVYKNGDVVIPSSGQKYIDDVLERIEITMDPSGKIVSYRRKDGTLVESSLELKDNFVLSGNALSALRSYVGSSSSDIVIDSEGWDIPIDELDRLAVEKADNMNFIKWTPKRPFPKRDRGAGKNIEYFPQGEEVTGIPYSATYEANKAVGFDVSLETFMTAVNNPYSLVYTEFCSIEHSISEWGTEYHGIREYSGPYYGSVCSEFLSACLGFEMKITTKYYSWLAQMREIGKILPQSSQGVKPGYIYYKDGHDAVIKAVKRNDAGFVEYVTVAEQSGDISHQTVYTSDDFDARYDSDNATIYKNISLKRSDIDLLKFDADAYVYNDDICTFAGNKACFREGELIVLNYNLDNRLGFSYTSIELYKNDELIETYQLPYQGELPVSQEGHAYKLPTDLGYGDYKACMSDGTNRSEFTEFKVIEASVTVDGTTQAGHDYVVTGDKLDITFHSGNAVPVSLKLAYDDCARIQGIYEFSDKEIQNGFASISMDYFKSQAVDPQSYNPKMIRYVEVFFATDYGKVTNDPIKFKFEDD